MRIVPFLISASLTAGLVTVLNTQLILPSPLGSVLSPQHGIMNNAEPLQAEANSTLKFDGLKAEAKVYFDERLVPHVFAKNDEDAYFIQGYLHAKYRLFQMDLQTRAAEGRASEIAGSKAIKYDKEQRRLGMRFAAENSLLEMEKDPTQKSAYDAYTRGVNSFIHQLKPADYPIEYKLINIEPEKWSNIRTALLLKMMAKMLAGGTESDLLNTSFKNILIPDELAQMYPQVHDSLVPIVPKGTVFDKPGITPIAPKNVDSVYFGKAQKTDAAMVDKPDENNGSNNWVVAGSKTKNGAPILCNDPHLELSLPSIWFEIQLHTPTQDVYGVSLPGSPFVIIGYNNNCAWGVTNAQRDVKDYFEIKFKDNTKSEYWFNNQWVKTTLRVETLQVKDSLPVSDTVAYTHFGPVMYDVSFSGANSATSNLNIAVKWSAHEASNEALTFYKLNRASNYEDYLNAIKTFKCPAQNFVFACKTGDIAIWQQGKFPARWNGQGLFLMPGTDSTYDWQGYIPQTENPHALNPAQGFLQSANQRPVDGTYPYYIPGSYLTQRGIAIHQMLSKMNAITPQDLIALQSNYFNVTAKNGLPAMLRYLRLDQLNSTEQGILSKIQNWDFMADANSEGQTIFAKWLKEIRTTTWSDEFNNELGMDDLPNNQTTIELMLRDSASKYFDAKPSPQKENAYDIVTAAFKKSSIDIAELSSKNMLAWRYTNKPAIYHLIKDLKAFATTDLNVGGNGDIINAIRGSHGPSWRMVVSLTAETEAYGVFPGGQSGNPGSKYYDNTINNWVEGKPYLLWKMRDVDVTDSRVKSTLTFTTK